MVIRFTRTTGWIFIVLGGLGIFTNQLFGLIQFDPMDTFLHIIFGVLAFAAVSNNKAKLFTLLMGPLLLLLGILGFFIPSIIGMNLEAFENLLHLLLGGWGIYTFVYKRG